MAGSFQDMLKLIRDLTRTLEDLTETQKNVASAVRTDDLEKLGECMKREQALSLALRNADQRRIKLQAELGWRISGCLSCRSMCRMKRCVRRLKLPGKH